MKDYEKKYSWLKVIRVQNNTEFFHKGRAYNIGIKNVDTRYICATDVDQIFHPGFFGAVTKALISHLKPFVMCRTHFWRTKLPKYLTPENVAKNYIRLLNEIPKGAKIGGEGCCMAFPTEWIKRLNGWDEGYIGQGPEDSDVMLRALLSGYKRMWITGKTNMIHLPHGRDKEYLRKNMKANKARYFNRKRVTKAVVVNKGKPWGQM
jgi:GT2 family glycosyltransferase